MTFDFKRGQTYRNRAGQHVHVVSITHGRVLLTLNEFDPTGIVYSVNMSGDAIFNDHSGDIMARVPRVYVAGPMTGIAELNFPLFNAVSADLRARGAHVENPAEINPDPHADWYDAMRRDIPRLLTCDSIHLLPGWEASRGASLEYHIAQAMGMTITYPE